MGRQQTKSNAYERRSLRKGSQHKYHMLRVWDVKTTPHNGVPERLSNIRKHSPLCSQILLNCRPQPIIVRPNTKEIKPTFTLNTVWPHTIYRTGLSHPREGRKSSRGMVYTLLARKNPAFHWSQEINGNIQYQAPIGTTKR